MEYYGKATKRARERAKATQQEHEDAVRKRMRKLGIPRAVAMHLLELETKIAQLDQNKR
jgi:glutaredoxin 2